MILIYAGAVPVSDGPKSSDFADLSARAKLLLHDLAKHGNNDIILPTVAISELLVPVPIAQHGPLMAALRKRFICQTHDLLAATIAATIWAQYKQLPPDHRYENRHVLKSDAMIVAASKAAGARRFYSHDAKCRKMAELAGMVARDLPTNGEDLFSKQEIDEND